MAVALPERAMGRWEARGGPYFPLCKTIVPQDHLLRLQDDAHRPVRQRGLLHPDGKHLLTTSADATALRRRALTWLHTELAALARRPGSGVAKAMQSWQHDPDLASLRDPATLAGLPPGERQACKQFWAEVQALRSTADAADKADAAANR
jgi:hypothetical protein